MMQHALSAEKQRAGRRAYDGALDAKKIPYRVADITEDAAALEYITQDLGYSQAPVVVVDDEDHWSGFRPDHIDRIAAYVAGSREQYDSHGSH